MKEANDLWVVNMQNLSAGWISVKPKGIPPLPRVYHSVAHCNSGVAQGMILVFGGRSEKKALSDLWGLTRHRDGTWSWREAPNLNEASLIGRYQHTSHCYGTLFIVSGGRTNLNDVNLPLDVFDMQTNTWQSFPVSTQKFRHGSWITNQFLYIHAGFQKEAPAFSTDTIERITLDFKTKPKLPDYFVDYLLQP